MRQNRCFFLSVMNPYCSAGDPAQRQFTAIIGKEYLSHFVAAIVPAFKDGQLMTETLGRMAANVYQCLQRCTDAAIERWAGMVSACIACGSAIAKS